MYIKHLVLVFLFSYFFFHCVQQLVTEELKRIHAKNSLLKRTNEAVKQGICQVKTIFSFCFFFLVFIMLFLRIQLNYLKHYFFLLYMLFCFSLQVLLCFSFADRDPSFFMEEEFKERFGSRSPILAPNNRNPKKGDKNLGGSG